MMLDVMTCPLTSIDLAVERAAMIATIVEIIRVYGKSDRRHGAIAPFLPVRMRTAPIMDLEPVRILASIFEVLARP
jgi:hypothetical protein